MSRNCPRVISPTPGRSTLITSAPNHASSCVQVGPDCTCVKSRIFTPSSALPISVPPEITSSFRASLRRLLANRALRIEIADAAALAPSRWIDHGVDERRLAGIHGSVDGALQLVRRRHIDTDAAERLHHLVVARVFDENGRGRVRTGG